MGSPLIDQAKMMCGMQILIPALVLAVAAGGCLPPIQSRGFQNQGAAQADRPTPEQRFREKPPVRTTRNLYEGGLWRGAASWGNLMRDHRARFRGDLLTIRDLGRVINVPEPAVEMISEADQPQEPVEGPKITFLDPVLRFLEEQRKRRAEVEREQNDILRSIEQVEVEVVRVLPNGNLLVRGNHPPIFRDQNRVKYLFSIKGIVRPSDVDDDNSLTSPKLSKAEYRIRRLVKRTLPPLGSIARAVGRRREGALLDRFTDFLTAPSASRTSGTGIGR